MRSWRLAMVACAVGGEVSSVDHGVSTMTISLPMVWRLVLGEDWWDARGDTTLSGLALGVDAPSECPTSPKAEVKGASESPDVGERDRDLDAWLDILRRVLGSKPVKREPPSGVSQPR